MREHVEPVRLNVHRFHRAAGRRGEFRQVREKESPHLLLVAGDGLDVHQCSRQLK